MVAFGVIGTSKQIGVGRCRARTLLVLWGLLQSASCDNTPFRQRADGSASSQVPAPAGPRVDIGTNHISLGGTPAGSVLAIDEVGRRQKVDELFDQLKRQREAWKEQNPGHSFPGAASLTAHAAASGVVLQSVVGTIFYAGYPTISIRVGGRFLRFRASERDLTGCSSPGEFTYIPCPPPPGDLVLHVQPGQSGWRLRGSRAKGAPIDRHVTAGVDPQGALQGELVSLLSAERMDALALHLPSSLRFDRIAPYLESVAEVGRRLQLEREVELRLTDIGALQFMAAPEVLAESGGKLAPAKLRSVMRGAYPSFNECISRSLADHPCGAVSVIVRFVIERDGRVGANSVEVRGAQSSKLSACIGAAAGELEFPPPEGGTVAVSQSLVCGP